ncbi:MAG TPA: von Willebrand factor type A domain-containing protein [Candidatus Limnocylindrales bacterium]|jgi:Ca-activated chloride channel family protein
MRRSVLLLAAVAMTAAACSSSSSTQYPARQSAAADHYQPTQAPIYAPDVPPATPYDGVTYQDPGVNPFVPTDRDHESTFGLDVDTASYAIAQRYVDDGNLPDPASVRVEEFVNAFDQDYAAPTDGTFAISSDGGPSPFLAKDEVLLRIGVKAKEVARFERPPAALTFVVDVSGSMNREDRLGLVKQALTFLVDRLRPRDTVAIVEFGSEARVVLQPTTAKDADRIVAAIDSLQPSGSTNAEAGLRLGYQLASDALLEGGINRVILASDGVANVGAEDPESILQRVRPESDEGIQLVTVGFGMGNYNDVLMEQLADKGDGFYAYVNQLDDARTLFGERLTSTLDTVALDARAQVDFNPDVVEAYRLVGYENRAIADNQFQGDSVDAGAIGAGHASTALYALRLTGERGGILDSGRIATVHLRWTDPDSRSAQETAGDVHLDDLAGSFEQTAPTFQQDALIAAAAERFRQSRWAADYDLGDVAALADEVADHLPRTDEVHALLAMLDEAARLER